MKRQDLIQLNVNIPKRLMEDIDNKAFEMGIPKTSLVIIAINQFLKTDLTIETLGKTVNIIEKENN